MFVFRVDTGTTLVIHLSPAHAVSDLHVEIANVSGVGVHDQILMANGKELQSGQVLKEINAGSEQSPVFLFHKGILASEYVDTAAISSSMEEDANKFKVAVVSGFGGKEGGTDQTKWFSVDDVTFLLEQMKAGDEDFEGRSGTSLNELSMRNFQQIAQELLRISFLRSSRFKKRFNELQLMCSGLSSALSNVNEHSVHLETRVNAFIKNLYNPMHKRKEKLLKCFEHNMALMSKMPVYEFIRPQGRDSLDKGEMGSGSSSGKVRGSNLFSNQFSVNRSEKKVLIDFLPEKKLRLFVEECKKKHSQLESIAVEITKQVADTSWDVDNERTLLSELEEFAGSKVVLGDKLELSGPQSPDGSPMEEVERIIVEQEGLSLACDKSIETFTSSVGHAVEAGENLKTIKETLLKMIANEKVLKEYNTAFNTRKLEMCKQVFNQLKTIVHLESVIDFVSKQLPQFKDTLENQAHSFQQLEVVQSLPGCFVNVVPELLRRKISLQFYITQIGLNFEALNQLRDLEIKRCERFKSESCKFMLNDIIPHFSSIIPPKVRVSLLTDSNSASRSLSDFQISLPQVDFNDIENMLSNFESLVADSSNETFKEVVEGVSNTLKDSLAYTRNFKSTLYSEFENLLEAGSALDSSGSQALKPRFMKLKSGSDLVVVDQKDTIAGGKKVEQKVEVVSDKMKKTYEEKIKNLEKQLSTLYSQMMEMKRSEPKQADVASNKKLQELSTALEENKELLKESQENSIKTINERDALASKVAGLSGEIARCKNEVATLNSNLEDAKQALKTCEASLYEKEGAASEIEEMKKRMEELVKENEALRLKSKEQENKLEAVAKEKHEVEVHHDRFKKDISDSLEKMFTEFFSLVTGKFAKLKEIADVLSTSSENWDSKLKELLALIKLMIDLLEDSPLSVSFSEHLQAIKKLSFQLSEMVCQITDVTSVAEGVESLKLRTKENEGYAASEMSSSPNLNVADSSTWKPRKKKISFDNFAPGCMALFLPVNVDNCYAAFNVNAPYHFLSRECTSAWNLAETKPPYVLGVVIEMETHTSTAGRNPFRLPLGTVYHSLHAYQHTI
eukprot:Nk52_evm20s287 gene=Nk52_evmTU20s287